MTETALVNAILLEFGARHDLRLWRQNTGAARTQTGALVRFGIPGQADISGILSDGRRIEIECKSTHGRLTKEQKAWRAMIERFGGLYVLARSVDDVRQALR
jgi:hypothetical protein